jgi:hypothetical protein
MHSRMNMCLISNSTTGLWKASSTTWLRILVLTSCMLHIKLPSTQQIQGNCMARQTFYLICYLKKTCDLGLHFKPDPNKRFECYCDEDFSGLWNKALAPVNPTLPSHKVVGSSSMQDALSLGPPNFNPKLHFPQLRLSTLQCPIFYVKSFLSLGCCRK